MATKIRYVGLDVHKDTIVIAVADEGRGDAEVLAKYDGRTPWTQKHLVWIRRQSFEHEAQRRALLDYLQAVEEAAERVQRLTSDIEELVQKWAPLVKGLQALGGIG